MSCPDWEQSKSVSPQTFLGQITHSILVTKSVYIDLHQGFYFKPKPDGGNIVNTNNRLKCSLIDYRTHWQTKTTIHKIIISPIYKLGLMWSGGLILEPFQLGSTVGNLDTRSKRSFLSKHHWDWTLGPVLCIATVGGFSQWLRSSL